MFIEVQETPNPNTLKFFLNQAILENNQTYHFKGKEDSKSSPLVSKLFDLEGIKGVFLGSEFISVVVENEDSWDYLKPQILALISDFLTSGQPILVESIESLAESFKVKGKNAEDEEIIAKIEELFEERIRPAVAMDGGDILFRDYEDGIVYLSLYGSCAGCPSSTITLKNGIENMLKYYIPQVKEVISIE
ncbi:MAG: NifU family protein [Alphaproteobacteria bacterium]|jgi:Fe-S cluster biogenesis protein NfuA|nr:NifU family protein [Alphaproteobacteria bacterium]